MPNPFFQNRTSPNSATAPQDAINDTSKKYHFGYNKFDFSRPFYNTLRYADITPHEVIEAWSGDKLPLGSRHEIRTHTLASPLMSDVTMKKSYYAVDYRAFLPNNWDKILVNPKIGDDINADNANTVLYNLPYLLNEHLNLIKSYAENDEYFNNFALPFFLLLECFCSNGSLLSSLGFHTGSIVNSSLPTSIDFDSLVDQAFNPTDMGTYASSGPFHVGFKIGDRIFGYGPTADVSWSWRQILDYARSHPEEVLSISNFNFGKLLYDRLFKYLSFNVPDPGFRLPLNYSRCLAYQLVCVQFFTNDNVDYVYNSELWLQSQKYCLDRYDETRTSGPPLDSINRSFIFNGISHDYDILSGFVVTSALERLLATENTYFYHNYYDGNALYFLFNFVYNIFSYRQSLRYGDYFTGARANVLAVGDVETSVVGNGVNSLDLTRNLMLQRFLNQVNRVGSRLVDYVRDILGGNPAPDVRVPRFLASVSSNVSGFEVENTAENQGDIVTLLKSSDTNYIYEIEVGEPCIIIGVTTFMAQRVYSKTADRFFFHVDRFDMFNPFMQYVGDQQIYNGERDAELGNRPFAYTGRHMEYKKRYPIASGGFINNLKSWLFITDNEDSYVTPYLNQTDHINPDYIRSQNLEFDRFYSSLTGVSLSSYFHFIVAYHNYCDAVRHMDYSPSIL